MIAKDLLENKKDNIVHTSKQYLNIGVVAGEESAVGEGTQESTICSCQTAISDLSIGLVVTNNAARMAIRNLEI